MQNYCTLFDSNYLSRGLVMYESLKKYSRDFHLYIFPFDQKSFDILESLSLEHITLVPMMDFEKEDLLKVKPSRTRAEYCWTCTPYIINYCMKTFSLPNCTYLDSDLWFFSDPSVLHEEMGNQSVLITEHRYTSTYDQSLTNGIYCVQFISFRNDSRGMKALEWWKDRCLEWCFNRLEDGKFGDQKYLDDWTTRFEGVHVLRHLGGGVAPWNVQQYTIQKRENRYVVNGTHPLVFYHFHWVRFLVGRKVDIGGYDLDFPIVQEIYHRYLRAVCNVDEDLANRFQFVAKASTDQSLREFVRRMKRKMDGTYNIFDLNKLVSRGQTH